MPYRTLSVAALLAALVAPTASAQQATSPQVVAAIDTSRGADVAALGSRARIPSGMRASPPSAGPIKSKFWQGRSLE